MSTVLWSLVLVLLLCFSSHACNARTSRVLHQVAAEPVQQHPIGKKNDHKLNPGRVPSKEKMMINSTDQSGEPVKNHEAKGDSTKKSSDTSKDDESISYVSWRVPHKKRGEEQETEFNFDYLEPRTHTPVHN
ncbi:hypothetical protein OROGR_032004 [Orobanche gracilis]